MALDYTVKYASKIANRFKLASKTNRAAGHEYEFTGAKSVKITNMLEEEQGEVESIAPAKLQFRPFEIKTLKVTY